MHAADNASNKLKKLGLLLLGQKAGQVSVALAAVRATPTTAIAMWGHHEADELGAVFLVAAGWIAEDEILVDGNGGSLIVPREGAWLAGNCLFCLPPGDAIGIPSTSFGGGIADGIVILAEVMWVGLNSSLGVVSCD